MRWILLQAAATDIGDRIEASSGCESPLQAWDRLREAVTPWVITSSRRQGKDLMTVQFKVDACEIWCSLPNAFVVTSAANM
jgi:hypothetical protein